MVLLAVSYEPSSLNSRKTLLESAGHIAVPASTLDTVLFAVWQYRYDLLVLGATARRGSSENSASHAERQSGYFHSCSRGSALRMR